MLKKQYPKIFTILAAVISSAVVAIAVSACSVNHYNGPFKSWINTYYQKYLNKINDISNTPILASTANNSASEANMRAMEASIKTQAETILKQVIAPDSLLTKDFSVSSVSVDKQQLPTRNTSSPYVGGFTVNIKSSDSKNKIPDLYNILPGYFKWKSTNRYFELNDESKENLETAINNDNSIFLLPKNTAPDDIHAIQTALLNLTPIKGMINAINNNESSKFIYADSKTFLLSHLAINNISNVDPKAGTNTGTFDLTLKPLNKGAADSLTMTSLSLNYNIQRNN